LHWFFASLDWCSYVQYAICNAEKTAVGNMICVLGVSGFVWYVIYLLLHCKSSVTLTEYSGIESIGLKKLF
jgi:hypothetical protein